MINQMFGLHNNTHKCHTHNLVVDIRHPLFYPFWDVTQVLLHNYNMTCKKLQTFQAFITNSYIYLYHIQFNSWLILYLNTIFLQSKPNTNRPDHTPNTACISFLNPSSYPGILPTWHAIAAAATLRYNPTTAWANVSPTLHSSSRSHGSAESRPRGKKWERGKREKERFLLSGVEIVECNHGVTAPSSLCTLP